jgi:hypothetical protein
MIEFAIKKNQYKIEDITIADYYKIQNLLVTEGIQAKLEIVSHLSGATTKELGTLEQFQFLQLWSAIAEGPLNTQDESKLYKHFILDTKLYGFMEFSKMTISEFADMEVLKQDPLKASKLHVMMAVLYRPATQITGDWIVTEEYNGDSVMERAEIFKNMPLKYVYGALHFFLLVQKYLLNNIADSLTSQVTEEMLNKLTPEQKKLTMAMIHLILEWQEVGATPSISSQMMILPNLEKLKELAQSVSSTTSPIEKIKSRKKTQLGKWLKAKINNVK